MDHIQAWMEGDNSDEFHTVAMTEETFEAISDKLGGGLKYDFDYEQSQLRIRQNTSTTHETFRCYMERVLVRKLEKELKTRGAPDVWLQSLGSPGHRLHEKRKKRRREKNSDGAWALSGAKYESTLAHMVVESGYSESHPDLIRDAWDWLCLSDKRIRLVLLVKIVKPTPMSNNLEEWNIWVEAWVREGDPSLIHCPETKTYGTRQRLIGRRGLPVVCTSLFHVQYMAGADKHNTQDLLPISNPETPPILQFWLSDFPFEEVSDHPITPADQPIEIDISSYRDFITIGIKADMDKEIENEMDRLEDEMDKKRKREDDPVSPPAEQFGFDFKMKSGRDLVARGISPAGAGQASVAEEVNPAEADQAPGAKRAKQ